jgi:hypothetical protein
MTPRGWLYLALLVLALAILGARETDWREAPLPIYLRKVEGAQLRDRPAVKRCAVRVAVHAPDERPLRSVRCHCALLDW